MSQPLVKKPGQMKTRNSVINTPTVNTVQPIVKPGQTKTRNNVISTPVSPVTQKTAYQQNLTQTQPKQDEPWTKRRVMGNIYSIYGTDPEKAQKMYGDLGYLQTDPNSKYYNVYSQATNSAASNLAALGFDTSVLTDDWFKQNNGWIQSNLEYRGQTNTPSAPTKKSTQDQIIAYQLYQYQKSEANTKQAEQEMAALREEISFKATRPDRNYSDDDIINSIDWSKYKTLSKAKENASLNAPTEFNRAMKFTDDDLYGWIWSARNGYDGDDNDYAMAMSYLGEGKTWTYDPDIAERLDPKSEKFKPYSVGSTGIDDAATYFGTAIFNKDWLKEHDGMQWSQDETQKEMYQKVQKAEQNTLDAEEQYTAIMQWLDEMSERDPEKALKLFDEAYEKGQFAIGYGSDYKKVNIGMLKNMDKSIGYDGNPGNGDLISMTRPVDYKYEEIRDKIIQKCEENKNVSTTMEYMSNLGYSTTVEGAQTPGRGNAGFIDTTVPKQHTKIDIQNEAAALAAKKKANAAPANTTEKDDVDVVIGGTRYNAGTDNLYQPNQNELREAYDEEYGAGAYDQAISEAPDTLPPTTVADQQQTTSEPQAYQPPEFVKPGQQNQEPWSPVTKQQQATYEAQDQSLKETRDQLYEIATPVEQAAMDRTWSVMFDKAKGYVQSVLDKGIQIGTQIVGKVKHSSVSSLSTAVLKDAETVQKYNAAQSEILDLQIREASLKPQVDALEERRRYEDATFNWGQFYDSGYDVTTQASWDLLTDEQQRFLKLMNTGDTTPEEVRDEYESYLEKNKQNYAPLTDEERAIIDEYKNTQQSIINAQDVMDENQDVYDAAQQAQYDAMAHYYAVIDMFNAAGIDTSDMEDAAGVSGFLLDFAQYAPTQWNEYSVFHELSEDLYRNGDYQSKTFTDAQQNAAELKKNIELADWVFDYCERSGIEIPDNVRENVLRWKEKLQREYTDYEYAMLQMDSGFQAKANIGKRMIGDIRALDENDIMNMDDLRQLSIWNRLNDTQKWMLEDTASQLTITDAVDQLKKWIGYDLDANAQVFGTYLLGDLLTDYEEDTYYYLLATKGADAAKEYYDHLTNDSYGVLHARAAEETQRKADELAGSGFWGRRAADALSMLLSPVAALGSFAYMAKTEVRKWLGERVELNPKNVDLSANIYKKEAREKIQAEINEVYADKPVLRKFFSSLQEMISNRGDSLVNGIVFGPLFSGIDNAMLQEFMGALPMAFSAATDAVSLAKEKGASDSQLLGVFGATLLAESVTEAVTLSNIKEAFHMGVEGLTAEGVKGFLKNWLTKSGIEEMIGESANDLIENWADVTFLGDLSDYNQAVKQYKSQGMSIEDAEAQALKDQIAGVLHTALISYLSPGLDIGPYLAGSTKAYMSGVRSQARDFQQMGYGNVNIFRIMQNDLKRTLKGERSTQTQAETQTQEAPAAQTEQAPQKTTQETTEQQTEEASEQEAGEAMPETQEDAGKTLDQTTADYTVLEDAKTADTQTQTAVVASVLDTEGTDESSDAAKAAATMLGRPTRNNDSINVVQDALLGSKNNPEQDAQVKQAIKNASLGGEQSAAWKVMRSQEYQNASMEEKNAMLIATLEEDANNPAVQEAIAKNVHENRVAEEMRNIQAESTTAETKSHAVMKLEEAKALAEKAAAQRAKVEQAKADLESRRAETEAAEDAVKSASEAFQADPSDDNLAALNTATDELSKKTAVEQEYEQSLKNAELGQHLLEDTASEAEADGLIMLRQEAEARVAETDQQRAEVRQAEQEAAAVAEEQRIEAERQQKIEDHRSGKLTEEAQREHLRLMAEKKGYTGEEAERFVEEVFRFAQDYNDGKIDMSKQFSESEGYLVMGALSRRFGVNVQITETPNGENGWYDSSTNTITLNKNLNAGQILVEFALHEFTHTLEQTGGYKQYSDFVLSLYESDAALQEEVARVMREREEAGHPLKDEDAAKREIVADFTRTKLANKETVWRMVDAGIGGRVRNALHNINQYLKNKTQKMDAKERQTAENLRRAERMLQKAIRQRAKEQEQIRQEEVKKANTPEAKIEREAKPVTTAPDGESITSEIGNGTIVRSDNDNVQYSTRTWTPEEKTRVFNDTVARLKQEGMSEEDAKQKAQKWVDDITSVATTVLSDQGRLDFDADTDKSMLKPNQDYYFTVDASTLCAKRLLYQGTFNLIEQMMPNTPLLPDDLIELANMMREMGYEAPCGICYVESRRRLLGKYAHQWLSKYDGEYIPSIRELTTSDGLEELRRTHPEAYEAFTKSMRKKGTANPKVVQLRTDYQGDISRMTDAEVQKVKDIGGLRIQSFSDFETPHLLDMMQVIADMASRGLTGQAYTKVPNFAWVFGDTGVKINLSLIGKGTGLDENGNLVFDDVEGMPFEEAMKLRERYSKNVGTILVGINDEHIIAAMGDDRIDFIIPFHRSGWSKKERSRMESLKDYKDYTSTQNERVILRRKKDGTYETESFQKHEKRTGEKNENFQPVGKNGYWDFSKSGQENAEHYLEMCAKAGRIPKFSQFLVDNGDGSFSLPQGDDARSAAIRKGYWKLLIDFKMYDNDGNGAAQQAVTTNVNMEEAKRVLSEYSLSRKMPNGMEISRQSNNDLPVATEVAEAFVKKYKDEHPGREYSAGKGELTDAQKMQMLKEADADYRDAVARGDMETAQEDVDFAAEQAGYRKLGFHGTSESFTVFNRGKEGIHLGTQEQAQELAEDRYRTRSEYTDYVWTDIRDRVSEMDDEQRQSLVEDAYRQVKRYIKDTAIGQYDGDLSDTDAIKAYVDTAASAIEDHFGEEGGTFFSVKTFDREVGPRVMELYARINNPFVIGKDIVEWTPENIAGLILYPTAKERAVIPEVSLTDEQAETLGRIESGEITGEEAWDALSEVFEELGYDGIQYRNAYEGDRGSDSYIALRQSDVKSADAVTYDENGNVISLSERFNPENPDIRYSTGNGEMTDGQLMSFAKEAGLITDEKKTDVTPPENLPGMPTGEQGTAQRQFGHQTAQESEALHQEVQDYLYTHSDYTPETNREQIDRAIDWVQSHASENDPNGYAAAVEEVMREDFDYRSADGQARMLTVMAMAAQMGDTQTEMRVADAYNKQGTDIGRMLQARKIFRLMTPLGRRMTLEQEAARVNNELANHNSDVRIELSPLLLAAAESAETEEDFGKVQKALYGEIASKIPANWKDKIQTWRMVSMLANTRTHIRNIVGNAIFVPTVGLKNVIASGLESRFIKEGGERTKAIRHTADAKAFAEQDAKAMRDTLTGEAKYSPESKIKQEQKAFGQGKGILSRTVGKAVQAVADANSWVLEAEDWIFLNRHYQNAMASYMTANGLTSEQMTGKTLEKARAYAIEEAQKATYRDANAISSKLNQWSRDGGFAGFITDAVLPFKKTPANILRRGIEYSPVGLIKSLATAKRSLELYSAWERNGKRGEMPKGAKSLTQVLDGIASGLTGTMISALGAAASALGAVKLSFGKEPDDELEKLEGSQEWSIELFGKSFTVDWAAPVCMPFFTGAAIAEQMMSEQNVSIGGLIDAISQIAEPVFNLSMLDGVNSLLKSASYSTNSDRLFMVDLLQKIGANYVSSMVPSALGATARTIDPTRRRTYVESGADLSIWRQELEKIQNKIPFLTMKNIPYRNVWGEAETSGHGEAFLENFILPGYFNDMKEDQLVNELQRTYDQSGDTSVIPKAANKKLGDMALTDQEYDQYVVYRGQEAKKLLTELINRPEFIALTPTDTEPGNVAAQVELIGDVWKYVNAVSRNQLDPSYKMTKWIASAKASGNVVDAVIKRQEDKAKEAYGNDAKASLFTSIDKEDSTGIDTAVEGMRQAGIDDKKIHDDLLNHYRDLYKQAARDGDDDTMERIRSGMCVIDLGDYSFKYDPTKNSNIFVKWEREALNP